MLGIFSYFCCRLLSFSKLTFSNNSFKNTIRVSYKLDPDQDRRSVGPDLGPDCLQTLSADQKKFATRMERVNGIYRMGMNMHGGKRLHFL